MRLNTFHISAPVLIRGIRDILSPQMLGMMTSLEIVINRRNVHQVDLDRSFTCLPSGFHGKPVHQSGAIVFPMLRQLRISFRYTSWMRLDPWTGEVDQNYHVDVGINAMLSIRSLSAIDRLLQRIAPPNAEVTVGLLPVLGAVLPTSSSNCGCTRGREDTIAASGTGRV